MGQCPDLEVETECTFVKSKGGGPSLFCSAVTECVPCIQAHASLPGARGNTKAIQKGAELTEKRESVLWMEDGQGS